MCFQSRHVTKRIAQTRWYDRSLVVCLLDAMFWVDRIKPMCALAHQGRQRDQRMRQLLWGDTKPCYPPNADLGSKSSGWVPCGVQMRFKETHIYTFKEPRESCVLLKPTYHTEDCSDSWYDHSLLVCLLDAMLMSWSVKTDVRLRVSRKAKGIKDEATPFWEIISPAILPRCLPGLWE